MHDQKVLVIKGESSLPTVDLFPGIQEFPVQVAGQQTILRYRYDRMQRAEKSTTSSFFGISPHAGDGVYLTSKLAKGEGWCTREESLEAAPEKKQY